MGSRFIARPDRCPLCGCRSKVTTLPNGVGKFVYNISCGVNDDDSDTCGLVLYGRGTESRRQMIEKWNTRHTPPTESEATYAKD